MSDRLREMLLHDFKDVRDNPLDYDKLYAHLDGWYAYVTRQEEELKENEGVIRTLRRQRDDAEFERDRCMERWLAASAEVVRRGQAEKEEPPKSDLPDMSSPSKGGFS